MANEERLIQATEILVELMEDSDEQTRKYIEKALEPIEELIAFLESQEAGDPNIEISMNVSGTPDLHIRNPKQFEKMKKYYDPARQPFTSKTWFITALFRVDRRPYKVVEKDGKPFQATGPKAGPDYYWIGLGVSDVTADIWNVLEIDYHANQEKRKENISKYTGGFRQPLSTWPENYKEHLR